MNAKLFSTKLAALSVLVAGIASSVSCMTTYDAYGRPVQSVDPGAAAVGAAAAGVAGYAIGRSNDDHDHDYYYRGGYRHHRNYYHGRTYYRHGYYRGYR